MLGCLPPICCNTLKRRLRRASVKLLWASCSLVPADGFTSLSLVDMMGVSASQVLKFPSGLVGTSKSQDEEDDKIVSAEGSRHGEDDVAHSLVSLLKSQFNACCDSTAR